MSRIIHLCHLSNDTIDLLMHEIEGIIKDRDLTTEQEQELAALENALNVASGIRLSLAAPVFED